MCLVRWFGNFSSVGLVLYFWFGILGSGSWAPEAGGTAGAGLGELRGVSSITVPSRH